jgi:hypothetical protein
VWSGGILCILCIIYRYRSARTGYIDILTTPATTRLWDVDIGVSPYCLSLRKQKKKAHGSPGTCRGPITRVSTIFSTCWDWAQQHVGARAAVDKTFPAKAERLAQALEVAPLALGPSPHDLLTPPAIRQSLSTPPVAIIIIIVAVFHNGYILVASFWI